MRLLSTVFAALLTAAVGGLVPGCGDSGATSAPTPTPTPSGSGSSTTGSATGTAAVPVKRKKITIGIVAKSNSNAVFQAAHIGARDAARDLADKYNADITINIQTPPDEDATKQAQAVEQLARSGAQGITVSCTDGNILAPAIDKAVEIGAEVMCFDSDSPKSKRFCYYGTDDMTAGREIMKDLAQAMGDRGVIAILGGNKSAPNLQARKDGVLDELKNHPNISLLKDGVFYHAETAEKAAETMQLAQTANPTITGWALIGGWPLFTEGQLRWDPGTPKIVSMDALKASLSYVRSGHVYSLLAQDCYGWGYKSVDILMDKIVNGKMPKDGARVIDPLQRVTTKNVNEYTKEWDKWTAK